MESNQNITEKEIEFKFKLNQLENVTNEVFCLFFLFLFWVNLCNYGSKCSKAKTNFNHNGLLSFVEC